MVLKNCLKKIIQCSCCADVNGMADSSSDEYCQEVFQTVTLLTQAFQDEVAQCRDDVDKQKELIVNFLKGSYSVADGGGLGKPRFPVRLSVTADLQWVNTETIRHSFDADAASNLILFDFFTHCCINCIHSIEDLREVYERIVETRPKNVEDHKFHCDFKLFSIHSPKFSTEKNLESIASSVARMKMNHTEVLNDPRSQIWQKFGVYCWPTILVFGPNVDVSSPGPNLVFVFTGEGHKELLTLISEVALEFFDSKITLDKVKRLRESLNEVDSVPKPATSSVNEHEGKKLSPVLNFPGKVTVRGEFLCISDSGNNRLLIVNFFGDIQHTIGGRDRGYVDGPFKTARFCNPQGTAFLNDDVFFVADTGNHCVRMVDIRAERVSTLVPPKRSIPGHSLKSPWDLCFYGPEILLIAGAGNHQIFGYFFTTKTLFGLEHAEGAFDLIAGTGREENRNNTYILRSSFAQPSGICCVGDEGARSVFIADSESSSVRMITHDGKVAGVVGGNRDPKDLFAYGDEDGISFGAKLQHPMGVCAPHPGKIYVADTYNHKIKKVKIETKHCTTLVGDGTAGNQLGTFTGNTEPKRLGKSSQGSVFSKELHSARLNEPAGVSLDKSGNFLFIADTNNHAIKVAHLRDRIVSELKIKTSKNIAAVEPRPGAFKPQLYQEHQLKISRSVQTFKIAFILNKVPRNFDGGNYKLLIPAYNWNPVMAVELKKETVNGAISLTTEDIPYVPWINEIQTIFHIMLCGSKSCYRKVIKLRITFDCHEDSSEATKSFKIEFTPPDKDFFSEEVH